MGCRNISTVTFMVVVVVLGWMGSSTQAQQDCVQDLIPCADYLNNTAQPSTKCCTAINSTVATKLVCLCGLYSDPELLKTMGANINSALRIATACGVNSLDANRCKAVLSPPPADSPPAVPGVPGGNGSGRIAWTGLPALLFFWVSVMLY